MITNHRDHERIRAEAERLHAEWNHDVPLERCVEIIEDRYIDAMCDQREDERGEW